MGKKRIKPNYGRRMLRLPDLRLEPDRCQGSCLAVGQCAAGEFGHWPRLRVMHASRQLTSLRPRLHTYSATSILPAL